VDDHETILHVPNDPRGLFALEPYNPVAYLTFDHEGRTISLRGYLRQSEWATLRFGVTDGVRLRSRRHRARLEVALAVSLVATDQPPLAGVTRDISVGGFSAEFEQAPKGDRFTVGLRLGSHEVEAGCQLTRRGDRHYSFRWTAMSPSDRALISSYVLREKALEAKWA
jgi:hypothetical protein